MNKITELKKKYECETTEELLNIELAPDYQCPKIDSLLRDVSAIESLTRHRHESEEVLKEYLDDINFYISTFEDELESIRAAIEDIRRWGQEWKDKAKRMIEKYEIDIEELD